jgi:uncharacterized coiled-coil DUF342 family protein
MKAKTKPADQPKEIAMTPDEAALKAQIDDLTAQRQAIDEQIGSLRDERRAIAAELDPLWERYNYLMSLKADPRLTQGIG